MEMKTGTQLALKQIRDALVRPRIAEVDAVDAAAA
jgi:hypothetical protein